MRRSWALHLSAKARRSTTKHTASAARKTYCIILRSTNGVHNPGTRGMLICQAAELAGRLHAYRESLHYMMRAGMIPADLLDDVKEVLK